VPKIKSHKGTKKTLKVKPSGTVTRSQAGANHKTGKKSANLKRKKRLSSKLSPADRKRLQSLI
jgi:ribosomal protein L35